jgi:hypothetical protein
MCADYRLFLTSHVVVVADEAAREKMTAAKKLKLVGQNALACRWVVVGQCS